tara:strand:+ start:243 stop:524 length:282 start_codon:yes stop_codon:yes gene_type:complete
MKKIEIKVQDKLAVGIQQQKHKGTMRGPDCEICQGRIGRACLIEVELRKYWCCATCYKIYSVITNMARFGILFDPNTENKEWVKLEREATNGL